MHSNRTQNILCAAEAPNEQIRDMDVSVTMLLLKCNILACSTLLAAHVIELEYLTTEDLSAADVWVVWAPKQTTR